MPSTAVRVDPRDVATVLALEPKVVELVESAKAAFPALLRLVEARYPGSGLLLDHLGGGQAAKTVCQRAGDGDLISIAKALDELRIGDGDQAALDYHKFCVQGGETVAQAATELIDATEQSLDRIDALRRYAATVKA